MEFASPLMPAWEKELRDCYTRRQANVFVLHGNVFDGVLGKPANDGQAPILPFLEYLLALLGETREHIYTGIACELISEHGARSASGEGREWSAVLPGLRDKRAALVLSYADMRFPASDMSMMTEKERSELAAFHAFSLDDGIRQGDAAVLLIVEALQSLHPLIRTSPGVHCIEVGLPGEAERMRLIETKANQLTLDQCKVVASHTAGLKLGAIEAILTTNTPTGRSYENRLALLRDLLPANDEGLERARMFADVTGSMSDEEIRKLVGATADDGQMGDSTAQMLGMIEQRKRSIIERECAGLIEVLTPKHGLDAVGGQAGIKAELMNIARLFKSADKRLAPMGLLAVGPMGSGKTFVIKAFLKEAGLTGVAFANFRSKWVGSTEANLERVLSVVKAMGPVAVIIDESDRSFGSGTSETDGGTSSRVIARLKEFMSDTENRGQVLFILMTNRPDKLDTDLKRPGRLDRKIPFFYAQASGERQAVLASVLKRAGFALEADVDHTPSLDEMEGYSNADIEAVALLSAQLAQAQGRDVVSGEDLAGAVDDFIPPRDEAMIQYMTWLAVSEASKRSLLPETIGNHTTENLTPEAVREQLATFRFMLRM